MRGLSRNSSRLVAVGCWIVVVASLWHLRANMRPSTAAMFVPGPRNELLLVFVASSRCPWIDTPDLRSAVERARQGVRKAAEAEGLHFGSIGIAVDVGVNEGTAMLRDFGPFDEVVAGRSWVNTGALSYVWRDLPGIAAVPQVLVVRRNLKWEGDGYEVTGEWVRLRKIGGAEIAGWSAAAFDDVGPEER